MTLAVFPTQGITAILPGKEHNSYTEEEEKKKKKTKSISVVKQIETLARIQTSSTAVSRLSSWFFPGNTIKFVLLQHLISWKDIIYSKQLREDLSR